MTKMIKGCAISEMAPFEFKGSPEDFIIEFQKMIEKQKQKGRMNLRINIGDDGVLELYYEKEQTDEEEAAERIRDYNKYIELKAKFEKGN